MEVIHDAYRVQLSQIEPRKRYQSRSRSLRAYSWRSRTDELEGVRRRLRDTSSRVRETMSGRLDLRSRSEERRSTGGVLAAAIRRSVDWLSDRK